MGHIPDGTINRTGEVRYRASNSQQQLGKRSKLPGDLWRAAAGLLAMAVCLLVLCGGVLAQEFRATISGTVTDPSGAVVPAATIQVVETHTGTVNRTSSNNAGQYVAPYLLPGDYSITVTKQGFQTLSRTGITLQPQQHSVVDLLLTVGTTSQTITVSGEAPLLDLANSSIGDVITTQSVESMPLDGRSPEMLAELSVGVMTTVPPQVVRAFDNGTQNDWSMGGTPVQSSEVLLDGAPDELVIGSVAFSPSEDTVQEDSVQPFSTDASFGHSIGGVVNMVTKSGTNALHGSAYEFSQLSNLDANLWLNGRSNPVPSLPVTHFNQYGLTAGGPVWIPKVFNGRDKLFFFFSWEGLREESPSAVTLTVPTDAEKEGDFSALLAGGSSYQLYEPDTGTLSGGKFTRTPVPNNCLTNQSTYCSTRANAGITIDPVAAAYLKFFSEPNVTTGVSPVTNENNYITDVFTNEWFSSEFGRLDYNVSDRDHMFFDFRHNRRHNCCGDNYYHNLTDGAYLVRENWGSTLDNVYTLNPTTVFDVRLNWMFWHEATGANASNYTASDVGLPSYLNSTSTYPELPFMNFNSGSYYGFKPNSGSDVDPSTSYQVFADMTKQLGRQTLKLGFDGRQYRFRVENFGDSSGSFSFGNSWVTSGTGGSSQPFGGDLASFEYGLPTSGDYQYEPLGDYRSYYVGAFFQDDFRVNQHLTLNMGLRFDIDTPWGEKLGRTVNGFNPAAVNSASGPASAAFSPTAVSVNDTTVTLNSLNTLGGLTYPSSDWGAPFLIKNKAGFWSPRIGFSYNPARLPNTVVRGGVGFFTEPPNLASLSSTGGGSSSGLSNQEGFSATTTYAATANNYFNNCSSGETATAACPAGDTPLRLDNPFPHGLAQPAGSSAGASTYLGEGLTFFAPLQHDLYSERWTLGVQQSLARNLLVEALYEGNHAEHLPVASNNLNAIQAQYLTHAPYRDSNLATATGTALSNPFAGLLPLASSFNGATTSLGNLLVPYPQFGTSSITEYSQTIGQSYYNSLWLHVEQRAKHGLTLMANYSFSKLIQKLTYLNPEDTSLYREVAPIDHTHHLTLGGVYSLPFGRDKLFPLGGSKMVDEIAGGWVVNGIYQFETGAPIDFTGDIPLQPGMSIANIKSQPRNVSLAGSGTPALVNAPNVFVTGSGTSCTVTSSQPCDGTVFFNGQYVDHYRTLPTTMGWVRQDGWNNLDASLLKNFRFTETAHLQLRFETFNTLNHPIFGTPTLTATSSSFGYITGVQANSNPRQVQLGARIVF